MTKLRGINDSLPRRLPKAPIIETPKKKSCFIDRNRTDTIQRNLGNFDYDELKEQEQEEAK